LAARSVPITRPDLLERRRARGGVVVAERGKATIVGRAQALQRNELGRLHNSIPHFLRCLDARVDRIDDSDEDSLVRLGMIPDELEHAASILLTRQLDVETAAVNVKARQEVPVIDIPLCVASITAGQV
jgi:hypothetical protein